MKPLLTPGPLALEPAELVWPAELAALLKAWLEAAADEAAELERTLETADEDDEEAGLATAALLNAELKALLAAGLEATEDAGAALLLPIAPAGALPLPPPPPPQAIRIKAPRALRQTIRRMFRFPVHFYVSGMLGAIRDLIHTKIDRRTLPPAHGMALSPAPCAMLRRHSFGP